MDQAGFEPTSSRVVGEVTLSFTTSNSIAFRQIRAGRKIEQSSGTTVPRRFTDEVTLLRTIPADPMGTIGSRLLFELLASCEAGGFSMPHLSGCPERSFGRSNAYLHHIGFVVAGISGPGFFFRCSTTELRQLSQPVGIEPTTIGLIEVTRSFTTPQTFLRFFVTSRCPCLSPSNTYTRSVFTETLSCSPSHKQKQSREELALTGLADSNRGPCGPIRRSNRKLHHPGRCTSG